MEKISLSQWLIYELVDKVDELTEEELEKYQVCAIVYLSERILQSFDLYGMNKDQLIDYLQNEVDMDAIY